MNSVIDGSGHDLFGTQPLWKPLLMYHPLGPVYISIKEIALEFFMQDLGSFNFVVS